MEKVRVFSEYVLPCEPNELQTNFRDGKGKVYMTHPTKALHKFMMQDFVRMRCVCVQGINFFVSLALKRFVHRHTVHAS